MHARTHTALSIFTSSHPDAAAAVTVLTQVADAVLRVSLPGARPLILEEGEQQGEGERRVRVGLYSGSI